MKFGMTQEQYQILEDLVITPLKQNNMRVFIFGSRTNSNHHSHSDVDILFQTKTSSSLPPGFISQIKESIEESRFPFSVDLVAEKDLASSYREAVFANRIEV